MPKCKVLNVLKMIQGKISFILITKLSIITKEIICHEVKNGWINNLHATFGDQMQKKN